MPRPYLAKSRDFSFGIEAGLPRLSIRRCAVLSLGKHGVGGAKAGDRLFNVRGVSAHGFGLAFNSALGRGRGCRQADAGLGIHQREPCAAVARSGGHILAHSQRALRWHKIGRGKTPYCACCRRGGCNPPLPARAHLCGNKQNRPERHGKNAKGRDQHHQEHCVRRQARPCGVCHSKQIFTHHRDTPESDWAGKNPRGAIGAATGTRNTDRAGCFMHNQTLYHQECCERPRMTMHIPV